MTGALCAWAGFAGFGIAVAFYGATLLPGVAYWDTGEMQTVPWILGITHPTGFPAFVIAGWAFSHLIAVGEPAWRLALFSALASCGAAGLLAAFVADVADAPLAGVAAAVVFALGDVTWVRGVRAEPHDVALFFIAFALVAANRASRARSTRALAVAGLATGLGLATHPVTALAIPGIVLVAWPALRSAPRRALAVAGALLCLGLATYAYVPIRSAYVEAHRLDPVAALGVAGGAFWDSDAPSNPASFARYVFGTSFAPDRSALAALAPDGLRRAATLAKETAYREYGYLVLALALSGFAYLLIRRPFVAVGMFSIAGLDVAFAASFGAESDVARYTLAGLFCVAACAGVGAAWLGRSIVGERPRLAAVLGSLFLIAGLWPNAFVAAADVARARERSDARPLLADVRAHTAPGSLVIASWTFAAPLAYQAYVSGTFRRRLLCGWPLEYATRVRSWRSRFGHVYVVVPPLYDAHSFATRILVTSRYQIAEVRS